MGCCVRTTGIPRTLCWSPQEAVLDKAYRGTDKEAVDMGFYLLSHEGVFVGSSSSMNCVGAVKAARELGTCVRVCVLSVCARCHSWRGCRT